MESSGPAHEDLNDLSMPSIFHVFATAALALVAGAAAFNSAAAQSARVVNVYNWSDYIEPKVIENFTKETGIKVQYDTFDANETLETKLLAGKSGYDVVVPTGYFLERQIKAGVFQKLDKNRLKNLGNVWPEVASRLAAYDSGNQYAVNYMWGTTGIGFNAKSVRDRFGPDGKIDSWDIIFKPDNLAKFRDCGIHMLDSADDILPAALSYLGLDPNTAGPAEYEKMAEAFKPVREYIATFDNSNYLTSLPNGELCVANSWSGDYGVAKTRAAEAGLDINLQYFVPKTGAPAWFDLWCMPADAKNKDNGYAFIDYMLRPEVIAACTDYTGYANANKAATPLVDESIRNDPAVYPDAETLGRMYTPKPQSEEQDRDITRAWAQIKAG